MQICFLFFFFFYKFNCFTSLIKNFCKENKHALSYNVLIKINTIFKKIITKIKC